MKKNKIARRLSLRAKFKSTDMVEVVIMDSNNNMQIELIPIQLKLVSDDQSEEEEVLAESQENLDVSDDAESQDKEDVE